MSRLLALLALLLALVPAHALPGRLEKFPAMVSAHVAARDIVVWLPDGYDAGTGRHAVLYMHDARNLFEPATAMGGETWRVAEALAKLQAAGTVRPTIVVGIDNTPARSLEYMPRRIWSALPVAERDRLTAAMGGPPLSDAYLKFIVHELKPLIDARFRTDPARRATFIMGSSMGGLISLYALAEYPLVFGGAGCLSTHWPLPLIGPDLKPLLPFEPVVAAFADYLTPRLPRSGEAQFWFDHGDRHLDANYAPYQARIDALLVAGGLRPGRDYVSRAYSGAAHNEAAWRARIDAPLAFLLAPR